ncbi:MAG: hypothetical protein R3E08_14190, partial [Thiotrichaceae bacterium]
VQLEELLKCFQKHLKLSWIMAPDTPADDIEPPDFTTECSALAPEQLNELLNLATIGDIQGILDCLQQLENGDGQPSLFVRKIRYLAENLQDQAICEILQTCMQNLNVQPPVTED